MFNHNMETVPRLYRRVRGPKSDYRWTLAMMRKVKEYDRNVKTKSGLMLGLGEQRGELLEALADLARVRRRFLDAGPVLATGRKVSSCRALRSARGVRRTGRNRSQMGFKKVASGPFVRSSYHARDMAKQAGVS